jgi:3-dehydroquinate synthase
VKIHSNIHDYSVHCAETADFLHGLRSLANRCFVVDANVWRLHASGCLRELADEPVIVLPVSEERKCLESVVELYDLLVARSAKRNLTLISIGGGILQDITGFTASTLYRGIPWVFVPTTLLAQADSCIGSKTSLNYKRFKNLIGTYYPPCEVFIHVPFLATLEDIDFFSGLGEVVKLHIMGGAAAIRDAIAWLPALARREAPALRTAIENALRIKQSFIADDEFDAGRRNMLNYGHCFGHAIEYTSEYRVPHGQAVVAGMLLANAAARQRGILSRELQTRLRDQLLLPSLSVQLTREDMDVARVVEAMKMDKKRTGDRLALVMIGDDGEMVKVDDLTAEEACRALEEVAGELETAADAAHCGQSARYS